MQPHFLPTIGARLMGWCWINKSYSIQSIVLSRAIHVGTKGNNVRGMRLCVY